MRPAPSSHRNTKRGISRRFLSALCLLFAGALQAQDDADNDSNGWYQVEVLVFAREAPAAGNEIWRQDLELQYPYNWVTLKDPDAPLPAPASEEEFDWSLSGDLDSLNGTETVPADIASRTAADTQMETDAGTAGDDAAPLDAAPAEEQSPNEKWRSTGPGPNDDWANSGWADLSTALADKPASAAPDLARQPFYRLPASEHSLDNHAAALRRAYPYRVLYHQAWRQPAADGQDAVSILVSGGDAFGSHHELEGTLSVTVSRFLHVQTNLWLTRFSHNFGQQPGTWPALPLRPDLRDYGVDAQRIDFSRQQADAAVPTARGLPRSPGADTAWQPARATSPDGSGDAAGNAWQYTTSIDTDVERVLATPYVPERILTLQQRRRMRSGELHYIDHPLMGILIVCTPYEVPPAAITDDQETAPVELPEAG